MAHIRSPGAHPQVPLPPETGGLTGGFGVSVVPGPGFGPGPGGGGPPLMTGLVLPMAALPDAVGAADPESVGAAALWVGAAATVGIGSGAACCVGCAVGAGGGDPFKSTK